jgi:hypothetical protein
MPRFPSWRRLAFLKRSLANARTTMSLETATWLHVLVAIVEEVTRNLGLPSFLDWFCSNAYEAVTYR